jgi:hypothetical protein
MIASQVTQAAADDQSLHGRNVVAEPLLVSIDMPNWDSVEHFPDLAR